MRRTLLLLTLALVAACAWGQPIEVPRIEVAPVMDGKLDDACWEQATVLSDFHVMRSEDQPAPTQARLCQDGVWLYLSFDCADPDPGALVATRLTRDGPVHEDDSLEIFISPYQTGAIYCHFLLSATNMRAEQQGRTIGVPTRSWDPGWRSATAVGEGGWRAEVAIPICVLGSASGDHWLINLCRNKRTEPAQYISLAPVERGYRELERFLPLAPLTVASKPYAPVIRDARVSQYTTDGDSFGYNLILEAGNVTGEAGELVLTVTDEPRLGEASNVAATLKLGPVQEREFEVFVPVAGPDLRDVSVTMVDPATGEQRQWFQVEDTSPLSPLHAFLDRSYYTSEATALAVCELQMPAGALAGWRLVALDAAGKQIAERADLQPGEVALSISAAGFPLGTHDITVQLRDPAGTLIADRTLALVRLAPAAHEAKVDRVNQVLLHDGEPLFPIGFLTVPGAEVAEHAAHGMTACSSFALPYRPDELDANDTLMAATENGLKCVEYLPRMLRDADGRRIRKMEPDFVDDITWAIENTVPDMIAHARDQESLIAYYSIDEPFGDTIFTGCEMLYDAIREHDPYHPVYLLFSSWIGADQDWSQAMDIPGVDPYMIMGHPTEQGQKFTLQHMACSTERARAVADEMHSTLWIIPESEFYSGSVRPLLVDEQICQTWMGLIYGARGLLWFRNSVYHAESWDNFGTLADRVKQLVPALVNRLPEQEITILPETATRWDYPILHARVFAEPGGGAIIMAANAEPLPLTARFELAGLGANATVSRIFADASPARDGAAFTDTLERYGTRAYRITGWDPPADGAADGHRLRRGAGGPGWADPRAPDASRRSQPDRQRGLRVAGHLGRHARRRRGQ